VGERDWLILDERVLHEGWIRVVERTYALPDGRRAKWELRADNDTVGVLPITPDGDIVLVRQFRPGPDRQMITIPGGVIDPGESPQQAARRELSEETGYGAESIQVVAQVVQASSTSAQFVAIAQGCRLVGEQQLDELEDCEVLVLAPDELMRLLRSDGMSGTQLVWPALDHAGLLSH